MIKYKHNKMIQEEFIMKRQAIINRIELLKARKADNTKIIKKLERKLRTLKDGD